MSEADVVARAGSPQTAASLAADLRAAGVCEGMTLLVHVSVSRLGWVVGGPGAVVDALLRTLGEAGTLMVPAMSAGNSEPANWSAPPVPEAWHETIRAAMPAHTPAAAPRGMGRVPEDVLRRPGVRRSDHPQSSFAALGPRAAELTASHPLDEPFGPASPLGRLFDLGGHVLLLGVGHANNSSLHLAEHLAGRCGVRREGAAVLEAGRRVWRAFDVPDHDADDFPAHGAAYEAAAGVRPTRVGAADARLLAQRPMVEFVTGRMRG